MQPLCPPPFWPYLFLLWPTARQGPATRQAATTLESPGATCPQGARLSASPPALTDLLNLVLCLGEGRCGMPREKEVLLLAGTGSFRRVLSWALGLLLLFFSSIPQSMSNASCRRGLEKSSP